MEGVINRDDYLRITENQSNPTKKSSPAILGINDESNYLPQDPPSTGFVVQKINPKKTNVMELASLPSIKLHHFWISLIMLKAHLQRGKDLHSHILQIIYPKIPTLQKKYKPSRIIFQGTWWGVTLYNNQILCLYKTSENITYLVNLSIIDQPKTKLNPPEGIKELNLSDIAVMNNQKIIGVDSISHLIVFFDSSGENLGCLTEINGIKLKNPRRIGMSVWNGRIAIASRSYIFVFDSGFNFIFSFVSGSESWGVGFQSNGNIVVADLGGTIRIHDGISGAELTKFGEKGGFFFLLSFSNFLAEGKIGSATFLFVDGRDYICISDIDAKNLAIFDPNGYYEREIPLPKDGHPLGVKLCENGNLIVCCQQVDKTWIRLFEPDDSEDRNYQK